MELLFVCKAFFGYFGGLGGFLIGFYTLDLSLDPINFRPAHLKLALLCMCLMCSVWAIDFMLFAILPLSDSITLTLMKIFLLGWIPGLFALFFGFFPKFTD